MNPFFPSFLMNFDEKRKKNQDAEKCYLGDVTNARDVTIDVDTCRQAGRQKKATLRYTTPKPNR